MFKSAFAQECLEETRASNTSTDSMLPKERHKLYKSQVKPEPEPSETLNIQTLKLRTSNHIRSCRASLAVRNRKEIEGSLIRS